MVWLWKAIIAQMRNKKCWSYVLQFMLCVLIWNILRWLKLYLFVRNTWIWYCVWSILLLSCFSKPSSLSHPYEVPGHSVPRLHILYYSRQTALSALVRFSTKRARWGVSQPPLSIENVKGKYSATCVNIHFNILGEIHLNSKRQDFIIGIT